MADYLKTNWTDKIKTNPVANMILNGKKREATYMVDVRQILKIPRKGLLDINTLYKHSKEAPGIITYDKWTGDDYKNGQNFDQFLQNQNRQRNKKFAKKVRDRAKRRQARRRERERESAIRINNNNNNNNNDNENIIDSEQAVPMVNTNLQDQENNANVAARKGAIGRNEQEAAEHHSQGDVNIEHSGQSIGNAIVIDDASDVSSDNELVDVEDDNVIIGFDGGLKGGSSGMWDNVYVKDFININHPKLRSHYIHALTSKPLQIKEPSVFFSDV